MSAPSDPNLPGDPGPVDTHPAVVPRQPFAGRATARANSTRTPPGQQVPGSSHDDHETHMSVAGANFLPADHKTSDSHADAVGGQTLDRGHRDPYAHMMSAMVDPSSHLGQECDDFHRAAAEVGNPPDPAIHVAPPEARDSALDQDTLGADHMRSDALGRPVGANATRSGQAYSVSHEEGASSGGDPFGGQAKNTAVSNGRTPGRHPLASEPVLTESVAHVMSDGPGGVPSPLAKAKEPPGSNDPSLQQGESSPGGAAINRAGSISAPPHPQDSSPPADSIFLPVPKEAASQQGESFDPPGGAIGPSNLTQVTPRPADVILQIMADALDDLERVRIATENRVRSLTQVKGLDGTPEEDRLAGIVDGMAQLEKLAVVELERAMKAHPLGPWVKQAKGLGMKQTGRLLASIGDPYIHGVTGEPRTVSQLWAYSGYHVLAVSHSRNDTHGRTADGETSQGGDTGHGVADSQNPTVGVAPSRSRGVKANWNAQSKMRAFLVAESCLKQLRKPCVKPDGQSWADHTANCKCSPYRMVYDDARKKYAEAVHPTICKRCGPSGKPAQPGSPLSDGHKHARGLRLVAKAVLRDLWLAARDVHQREDEA